MCIAIYKPAGVEIERDTLRNCWDHNKDGAGFMYPLDGKLVMEKGFMRWKVFKRHWNRLGDLRKELPIVLHFRTATHGSVSPPNCHPFKLEDTDIGYVHNGVIREVTVPKNSDLTDSEVFGQAYLNRLSEAVEGGLTIDMLDEAWLHNMIDGVIGHSKLVFMDNEGKVTIVGEKSGWKVNGVWYSNTDYKPPHKTVWSKGKAKIKTGGKVNGTPYTETERREWWEAEYGLQTGSQLITEVDADDDSVKEKMDEVEWWVCRWCDLMFQPDETVAWTTVGGAGDMVVPDCPSCNDWSRVYVSTNEDAEDILDEIFYVDVMECAQCSARFFEDEIEVMSDGIVYCPFCDSPGVEDVGTLLDYSEENPNDEHALLERYMEQRQLARGG
jgi:hypothetical protein